MNWLMYLSWVAGPALQVLLLFFMTRRRLRTVFPRFFSYILFQIIKSACLFIIYRYCDDGNYFDAYWTGNALSVLLAVTVMDEILQNLFKQYGGVQNLGLIIFRWSCGLFLVLAIVSAISSQEGSADRIVAAVLGFDRSVRLMQCGLFLLLMLLCRFVRDFWRQHAFGIALGFGVFASIELILVSLVMRYGDGQGTIVSLVQSLAFNGVTLLWLAYLRHPVPSIPEARLAPRLTALNMALVNSTPVGDKAFLSMAEEAVDRVLSRRNWPAKRHEVVGRKPDPEERN